MESHLNTAMNLHLNLACVRFQKTIVELAETRSQLQATRLQLERTKEELDTTTFVWKIDGFGEIFRQAMAGRNQTINSDPFYTKNGTGRYGYKLKVRISPNDQRTNQLSVFIIVMKGEYDAILPWPFTKKVKFTLIDQQADLDERDCGALRTKYLKLRRKQREGYCEFHISSSTFYQTLHCG